MSKRLYRILQTKPIFCIAAIGALISAVCLFAGEFRIRDAKNEKGKMRLEFESGADEYAQIWVCDSLTSRWEVLDVEWGRGGKHAWIDPSTLEGLNQRFYRVHKCPLTNPGDADGDGIDDVFELQDADLSPVDGSDAVIDFDGDGTNELAEYQEELPKLVLHSISDSPDPFSPMLTSLNLSARHLIRATDALTGASHSDGQNKKSFYIRQSIEILDGFGEIARRLEKDFLIDPADITNASKYITVSTLMSWDGNNEQGARVADGSYTYRIAGIFIRVNESGGGQGEGKEKEICVSDTLEGTVLLDATAPEIISYSPAHGAGTDDPRTPITVMFVDRVSGVNPASVAMKVDGVDVTADSSITATNITWTPSTDLLAGRHIVAISLKDNAGNAARGQIIFTVDIDKDGDGLPDWWEKMYLGTLSKGAGDDVDRDGLSNLKEYDRGTDPGNSDTDKDGFSDDFDNAVSRAFIEWGHADFSSGDEYIYAMPSWLLRAYKDGGEWVVTVLPYPPGPLSQAMGSSGSNPIPWSEIDWENPDFDFGDERIYISKDWLVRVFKDGDEYMVQEVLTPLTRWQADELLSLDPWLLPFILGLVDTESPGFNPSEWHVPASEPEGTGSLNIEIDRAILTNDLVMEIKFVDHAGSSLYVDLLAGDYTKVATNLYGNLITGTDVIAEKSFDVPLESYAQAAVIQLRRGVGEITVGETILYVDKDHDELDAEQEAQLSTSDLSQDTDGDGTGDKVEVDAGTDPTDSASFLANISGTISYSGSQTGNVIVTANTSAGIWPIEYSTIVPASQFITHHSSFIIPSLPTLTNYWVHAFIDKNGNGSNECWEAIGSYAANPVFLTDHTVGIDITLNDPPDKDGDGLPDCWELKYFKSATAGIAGRDEEPDGLTNLQEFEQNTDPFNPDTRGKRTYDGGCFMCLQVTSTEIVPEGMKISIGYRDDFTNRLDIFRCFDLVKGEWELVASNLVTTGTNLIGWVDTTYCNDRVRFYAVGNTADFDNDGLASGREHYLYRTDSFKSDTDGDRINDKEEIDQGTDPTENPDSDGDSLGDHWEIYYFGNTNSQNSTGDPDDDGFMNVYEFKHDSNPTNPVSVSTADYYVNCGTGNDMNDGMSPETAKATIQAAIDAAGDYDIVQVADGAYSGEGNRNLNCGAKKIMVRSENGPRNCVINCEGSATYADRRAFYFGWTAPPLGRLTVVDGFTIANGWYDYGGGIYCYSASPTIRNCLIDNCRAYQSGTGAAGAGIYWDGGAFKEERVIENCRIRKNRSDGDGGGIVIKGGESFTIANCTIESNSVALSTGAGGGIYVGSSSGSISNCTVRNNIYFSDVPMYGGGIYCCGSGNLRIQDSLIVDNYSRHSGGGGGIAAFNRSGDLVITNCAVSKNFAAYLGSFGPGGGIYCYGSAGHLMIYDTEIRGNKGSDGGGVYLKNIVGDVEIKRCLIEKNEASSDGAGIHFENSDGSVNACRFFGNIASARGGALHFENTSAPVIQNSLISRNQADTGGGLCATNSRPIIINCTITTNIAASRGGAVEVRANAVAGLINCILWEDSPGEIYVRAGTVAASYCDIQGGYAGEGNINQYPLLYLDGHHLSGTNSPCFNAGTLIGAPDDDFEGDMRPSGIAVDIGWDEYIDSDSDNLPDWWEVHYGLDPQDNGSIDPDNGASGDPDEDGLDNLWEYQQASVPTDRVKTGEELVELLLTAHLRVEVEDSKNCGGTNPYAQVVTRTFDVGRLVDCGYFLEITVQGSVETQDAPFDKVYVNDVFFFQGSDLDGGCQMTTKMATKQILVTSGDTITLKYDTVDGLYHVGAYAEIVDVKLVGVLKVELDIGSVSDADEESTGGFVPVNADNDNKSAVTNHIPATRDFDTDNYTDNDLVSIFLSLKPTTGLSGTLRLRKVEGGRDRIKIWETTGKATEVSLPKTWNVGTDTIPATLQVEGLKEGKALRELDLILEYLEGGTVVCDDKVKATVTPVLKKLEATNPGNQPDYVSDAAPWGHIWMAGSGEKGVHAADFAIEVEPSGSGYPVGELAAIHYASVVNSLTNGYGFRTSETPPLEKKWEFQAPYTGMTLVDCGDSFVLFYPDLDSPACPTTFTSHDKPNISIHPGLKPWETGGPDGTDVDITYDFSLSAVWMFPAEGGSDSVIYFLGYVDWSARAQGQMRDDGTGGTKFVAGSNNKNTGSTLFTRDNTDRRTEPPSSGEFGILWYTP